MAASIPATRRSVKIAAWLIVLLLTVGLLEVGARIIYHFQFEAAGLVLRHMKRSAAHLNDYEIPDPRGEYNWVLRPNYRTTVRESIAAKERTGNVLGVQYLRERSAALGWDADRPIIEVNSDGYKGPELDPQRRVVRILSLGDSCTFGSYFDYYSYPRALERALRERELGVEVINGGVEGYSPRNVLLRIEEFKALRPEITTVYIGWNAMFATRPPTGVERYLRSWWLVGEVVGKFRRKLGLDKEAALEQYLMKKNPDRDAAEIDDLDGYRPVFLPEVETIVTEMRAAGSEVVLVTVPGLYTLDENPSARALEVGHLPEFTDNPFVLAKLSTEYNQRLRELAQRLGVELIDLEEWSRAALEPRDRYFFDSVHLYEEGQEKIGEFLAERLSERVAERSRAQAVPASIPGQDPSS
jgi:lysophospholipase L1-like esterase